MTLHCTFKSPKILVLFISKTDQKNPFLFLSIKHFLHKYLMGLNDKIFQCSLFFETQSLRKFAKVCENFILYRYCKYCFSIIAIFFFAFKALM